MNKINKILILVVILTLLVGCVTVPSPGFDVAVVDGKMDDFEITAEPIWLGDKFAFEEKKYGPGVGLFLVKFNNKSNEVIKILWEESSIVYNGSSYTPFVAGQKYIDAGQPANPTIIHKNTAISKEVYSSEQVKYSDGYYVKGWYTTRIDSPKTALVFCVVREDSKKYITVEVLTKPSENNHSPTEMK